MPAPHKLRIAFLSCGSFIHIGPYIDFFRRQGHTVFWIAYDRITQNFGVSTHDISHGAVGKQNSTKWRYLLAGITLRRLMKELAPDILHGHYVTSAGTISVLSGFRPYVLTVHGSDVYGSLRSHLWRSLLPPILMRASLVNPVSDELASLTTQLGVPEERILTATLGVDIQRFAFRPKVRVSSPLRLLCTRNLNHVYDPATIIHACEILKRKGVAFELTFAAGGPLQKEMQGLVARQGLSKEARFLGGFSNEQLPEILHAHDFYISASLWDGTSISLLEAMSCGMFPIVSRISSNQAWVAEGRTACMFECGKPEELAEGILHALADEEGRKNAVYENRRKVEQKGDRNQNMAALENGYYRILSMTK